MAENRPRLWWIGSRAEDFKAEAWKKKVEGLHAKAQLQPRQSMYPYFQASVGNKGPDMERGPSHEQEASYSKYFADQVNKAIAAKRLPKDIVPPARQDRPSASSHHLAGQTPWTQAVADCLDMALSHIYDEHDLAVAKTCGRNVVGDLSQNCGRCRTSASGWWGTLTTSSRLYDFNSGKFLDPQQHLALMGFDISKLHLETMTAKDS